MSLQMDALDVAIVGGGVAGLRAATVLEEADCHYCLFEKDNRVGGRVHTVQQDGFLLDRGFQVLLDRYGEVRDALDLDALDLHAFRSGARIQTDDGWRSFVDPLRHPGQLLNTMTTGPGNWVDYLRLAQLTLQLSTRNREEILDRPETTTREYLEGYGFSETLIDQFFQPFLAGVFLEPELQTSSRMFEIVYRMFTLGRATLPATGMEAIPRQMASKCSSESVRTGVAVETVEPDGLRLETGTFVDAEVVIEARSGFGEDLGPSTESDAWNGTSCYYFAVDQPPVNEPILMLNAQSPRLVNHFCVPSMVCSNYAPGDTELLSVSTSGVRAEVDHRSIVDECRGWFGDQVEEWTHLRTFHIERALPRLEPQDADRTSGNEIADDPIHCGDHTTTPSLNGAMISGRRAAEQALEQLMGRNP